MKGLPTSFSLVLTALFVLLAAGCASPGRQLLVIHTTDVHGYYRTPVADKPGGLERLAAFVEARRREGPVLLVDSGDVWSGTQLSDRTEGTLGVAAYNLLGYDAVAVGNHEFDYGPLGERRQGGDDPFSALKARLAEGKYPMLAANLEDRQTGELPAWPGLRSRVIVERGGLRIGLAGVVTPDTPNITFPHVGERLKFNDPVEALADSVMALREEGAQIVFVLAHIGGRCADTSNPEDLSSCETQGPIFQMTRGLAERVPEGSVQAVFGGHTHSNVAHYVSGIPVLQGGRYGEAVSLLRVSGDAEDAEISFRPPRALRGDVGPSRLAAQVRDLISPYEAELAAVRDETLGARLARPLPRSPAEGGQLGAFFCDVLMKELPGHDLCILNSGGLREELPLGPITYGQLYDVLPFGNRPATLEISGRVLLNLLQISTSGAHGAPQSSGLFLRVDRGMDPCPETDRNADGKVSQVDRKRLVEVRLADGRAIQPDQTYRLLTNSFLAKGGDAWRSVLSGVHPDRVTLHEDALPIRDVIARWMRRTAPVINSADLPAVPKARLVFEGSESGELCPSVTPEETPHH